MTEMKHYMTDRRKYERPRMRVVELRQRPALLAGSTGASTTMDVTYEEEDI